MKSKNWEKAWLYAGLVLVTAMVLVGGITRLTCSGLSIVDWRPVTGVIPPLSQADWQAEFQKYQGSPEYQILNNGMGLEGFKSIFFWEYLHRLIGRLIGVVFIVPFIIFYLKGWLDTAKLRRYLLIFGAGALQGVVGWYMVKSGLVDKPHVSHFRLAMHFVMVLLIISLIVNALFRLENNDNPADGSKAYRRPVILLSVLVLAQLIYGAFVAGLKAGYGYNTWPLMEGALYPSSAILPSSLTEMLFSDNTMVQFIHRWLGMAVLLLTLRIAIPLRRSAVNIRTPFQLFTILLSIQVLLGIVTLLTHVNIVLASMHQLNGVLVFVSLVRIIVRMYAPVKQVETIREEAAILA